jgi:PAS domain S-box-containing protein
MRLELGLLFAAGVGYLVVLFLLAYATERGLIPARLARHPAISTLALGVYASSWSFNGSVGFAKLEGYRFLAIYLGVTLACALTPLIWQRVLSLTREYQLTSLADLFVFRYRGSLVGALVTLFMLAGSVPYLALEIRAITESVSVLAYGTKPAIIALGFCAMVALFAILFGARHPAQRDRHQGLVVAIAFESVVKLVALLAVGAFAVFGVFDGLGDMNRWIAEHPEALEALQKPVRDAPWGTLLLLSFAAAFLLPRQFHVAFAESPGPRALSTSSWGFPAYLLLLNLPVVPILLAGTALKPDANPEYYVLGITLAGSSNALSGLAFVGGLSAASGTVILTTLALASMSLNHLLLPLRPPRPERDLYAWLLWARRALIVAIIVSGFGCFLLLDKRLGLAELGLISFAAVAQFLPGLGGVLFWPRATRAGFVAGLCGGIAVWATLLALPVLAPQTFGTTAAWLRELLELDDPWSLSVLLSLSVNALLFAGVSTLWPQPSAGAEQGFKGTGSARVAASSASEFRTRLESVLGEDAAEAEVQRALTDLTMPLTERRPAELVLLRDRIERNLSGLMGPVLARMVVDDSLRMDQSARTALADQLRILEERLREARIPLQGAALELEAFRSYFRQILEDLPQGVCALGPDTDVVIWNRALSRMTGVSSQEAVGHELASLPAPWGELLNGFAQADTSTSQERRVRTSNGERVVQLFRSRLDPSSQPGGQLATHLAGGQVILLEDLTDSKLLQAQVAHQDRLASIGRLAAGVAHEIGNPLTGIACVAQNLPFDMDPAVVEERAELIVEQTRRIDRIVRSLVSFSHAGVGAAAEDAPSVSEPFKVRDAVEEAMDLVRLSRQARGVESINLCSDGLLVEGDRNKLIQVFVNLLTNACDASSTGARVEVSARRQNGETRIAVADSGAGIPEAVRDRIFEPFFTTKVAGEGTGLGLSLVYSIVREHRGSVEVTSTEGVGTTITVVLPHAEAS